MKEFPFEHESQKETLFYPEKPEIITGDVLEVGPGRGDVLLYLAQANPQKKFVAVEIGKKRYFKLIERIEKRKLTNILLIKGDARVVLPAACKEGTFEKIMVLFPDPWPKDRHAFRRLLTLPFLTLLTHFLKSDGTLITATDVPWYAGWAFDNLSQVTDLKNHLAPATCVPVLEELPESYFEKKWKDMGRSLYFMRHLKTPAPSQT